MGLIRGENMGEKFKIIKEIKDRTERVTLTIPVYLESKELYWLKHYGIEDFDKVEFDLKTGQVILTTSILLNNLEEII